MTPSLAESCRFMCPQPYQASCYQMQTFLMLYYRDGNSIQIFHFGFLWWNFELCLILFCWDKVLFRKISNYLVAQADLELPILLLLPPPPKCWDYRHIPPHLADISVLLTCRILYQQGSARDVNQNSTRQALRDSRPCTMTVWNFSFMLILECSFPGPLCFSIW